MTSHKKIAAADLRYDCGNGAYTRGEKYFEQNRVVELRVEHEDDLSIELYSVVKGNGGRQYVQQIELSWFSEEGGPLDVSGSCSCPVGYNCKHVVAACLAYEQSRPKSQVTSTACLSWLDTLDEANNVIDFTNEFIAYVIQPLSGRDDCILSLYVTREKKSGGLTVGRQTPAANVIYSYHYNNYIRPEDVEIARILTSLDLSYGQGSSLEGAAGYIALQKALKSGRLFWKTHQSEPLVADVERSLDLSWQQQGSNYKLRVQTQPADAMLLPTEPPLYIDEAAGTMGEVLVGGLSQHQFRRLLSAPVVPAELADEFSRRLIVEHPELSLPPPQPLELSELNGAEPIPRLRLFGQAVGSNNQYSHFIMLSFDYDDYTVSAYRADEVSVVKAERGYVRIQRNTEAEITAVTELAEFGFYPNELAGLEELVLFSPVEKTLMDSAGRWAEFLDNKVPELEERGWIVEQDDSFLLQFQQAENWDAEIEQTDHDWFQMRFNITVNDQSMPLMPLIMPVLEQYSREELPDMLSIPLESHHYIKVPATQLKPFLDILYELFDSVSFDEDGNGRLSRYNAAALADMEEHSYGVFSLQGGAELLEIGKKLRDFRGIEDSPVPAGLQAQLRDYQRQGLSWLQFLRAYDFAGILADDMGLGKTVQTLSHLLLEKEAGRMDKPCLIIAPTSLMSNWRREAERFTPQLSVLTLQGVERKQRFDQIAQHDLVLTTYPLLPRDKDALLEHQYYFLILDEAQTIKNPKAQAARLVRKIDARHRLCLTGTPMENHLGELWAQFDFLMPGFLGNNALFRKVYRTPIEVYGEEQARERLSKRVEPFMLRRTKRQVADELPEKTEIVRSVPLSEKQAALYESIRISMEKKVREAIATKGMARSHITILDALLKLRQTCCDPRTLSLKEAQKVTESAKLDLLLEMLPELLEEGRRILVFSQFTKMLGLIEAELKAQKIAYSKLTGQTRKRDEAIERFKSGEADVFLISLKAGGVGLNLTEADTVIIYDPWWNPAVESQAADRAHRIGQEKAVFVYKLLTENTVEEKILAMQEKKRALADGVYQGGQKEEAFQLNADDLTALLKPIDL
ncbi:DEAD/DEAH box helicase [Methylomarinum sp. Ch1-1]|uniref:DEAD/DEAH box helicase n=1 Tax=Methylomarinum roseum TaxID=3067653 RepID=A0AAU7NZK6_9GAMM|nr:DEAD/DEAH box helicase [Methylomarinum sp. Ch1-1]MDP4521385.1 DEAD/DEAH box helicase [Methylomarinum sp. Ch1-1]